MSPLNVTELSCEGAGGLDDEEILDCFSVAISYFKCMVNFVRNRDKLPRVMAHTFDPSTWESEACTFLS